MTRGSEYLPPFEREGEIMPTIAERVAECDRLIGEMDPADVREVLLAALRERYGGNA